MAVQANSIRKGMVLDIDGELFMVMTAEHRTPGNLRAFVQARLRSLKSGSSVEKRFRSTEAVNTAYLETHPMEYLYQDGSAYTFMNAENYEQITLDESVVGEYMPYVPLNSQVAMTFHDGKPLSVDLPTSVVLTITDCEPGTKGDSVTNIYKPATTETGLVVKVPLHVDKGQKIKVDTRTGEFLSRVND